MLLRIEAPHFVAGTEWRKDGGQWVCFRAAPILKWMLGKPASFVGPYIKRRGWSHQWL